MASGYPYKKQVKRKSRNPGSDSLYRQAIHLEKQKEIAQQDLFGRHWCAKPGMAGHDKGTPVCQVQT